MRVGDGTLAGDMNFDPLKISDKPESLAWCHSDQIFAVKVSGNSTSYFSIDIFFCLKVRLILAEFARHFGKRLGNVGKRSRGCGAQVPRGGDEARAPRDDRRLRMARL